MDSQTVSAAATAVAAGAAIVYTFVTWRLLRQTKQQAEIATHQAQIAERQAIIAQQMLDAAHRPWLSIVLYADAGTDSTVLNVASVFRNHGDVPATVTKATLRGAWEGKTWAQGDQLVPTGNPSNLCIFPGQQSELGWGILNPSFAPWPKHSFLRLHLEITYRGAFEERIYHSRVEASFPVPEGRTTGRSGSPMQIVNEEAK
jgi:hypothetical protein